MESLYLLLSCWIFKHIAIIRRHTHIAHITSNSHDPLNDLRFMDSLSQFGGVKPHNNSTQNKFQLNLIHYRAESSSSSSSSSTSVVVGYKIKGFYRSCVEGHLFFHILNLKRKIKSIHKSGGKSEINPIFCLCHFELKK